MVDYFKTHIPSYELTLEIFDKLNFEFDSEINNKILLTAKIYNPKIKMKRFSLKLLLTFNKKTGKFSLSICGSIRKWHFQENSRSDLTKEDFKECIKSIAEMIGVETDSLRKMKVTQMEFGITLLLKSFMRNIIKCFIKLPKAKREVYEETTLYFKFENYQIKFYDKYLEMNKYKIWTKIKQNVFNKFYFLRIEIRIKKMSGATTFKDKFGTVGKIEDNWDDLPLTIEKYLNDITFLDTISQEKKIEPNNITTLKNQLMFWGMKKIGIKKFTTLFDKSIKTNNSKFFKELIDIFRSLITDDIDLKKILFMELRKKSERLL